ncbi:MAG: hypothetical protein J7577_17845 [Sphingobacteriaceae bacterium]|nr:hypothetical protein [Sphingobacteriaceae bacterium]
MIQDFKSLHLGIFSNVKNQGFLCLLILMIFCCSQKHKDLYKSTCDGENTYQKINLAKLLENIDDFQGKYVEIEGLYKINFEESALYTNNKEDRIWVNFDYYISKCPLVSSKDNIDLFGKGQYYQFDT